MKKAILIVFTFFAFQTFYSQSNCSSPSANALLSANNIGIVIGPSGNTGFDHLSLQAGYEAPIGQNTYSIFAMSSWIGGVTANQELRFAGQLYRQSGDSYWAGPLPADGSLSLSSSVCEDFDKIWDITRAEVDLHREYFSRLEFDAMNGTTTASDPPFDNGYTIPDNLWEWPANNVDPLYEFNLAPYIDVNGDDVYDPNDGDYPAFYYPDLGAPDLDYHLFGDVALWWVFNDFGNIHQELAADAMGVEFQCTAYAFSNVSGLENTVFFRKKVTNRSTESYSNTYLSQWVDGDLGCYQDDYIACNVEQSLGITLNGDEMDENCAGALGYGINPPAVGTDILRGPLADENDGIDNNLNGEVDEEGEFWTMSKFSFFENSTSPVSGNPSVGIHAYNLMRGFWKNGQQMTFGEDGTSVSAEPCSFAFPGDSDSGNVGTNGQDQGFEWTESSAGNAPGDRRYIQSAGPFTFEAGETVYTHSAVVWAQSEDASDPFSIDALEESDVFVQDMFDDEFEGLISGILLPESKKLCNLKVRNGSSGEISFNINSNENYTISLFDLQGKKVFSESVFGNEVFNHSNLNAGIYLLQLESDASICSQKVNVN